MSRMIKKGLPVVEGTKFAREGDKLIVSNGANSVVVVLNGFVDVDTSNGLVFKSLEDKDTGMLGTTYVAVKNAMNDLKNGVVASLKMIGVGFKASVQGKFLRTYIGLSHDVCFAIPAGLTVSVANDTEITIKGFDRAKVMQFAMAVRSMKKPEPYKGKGIFLNGERVIRKEGKKK